MHNISPLVRGSNTCTAQLHPDDAARLGLANGSAAVVCSRSGAITIPVEVTETVRRGVVSIPHGWGHDAAGTRTAVASQHPGTNSNILADDLLLDAPSGTAVLNGIPITVTPAGGRRMDRMSAMDAMFYYMEDENTPMHVGGVAVLEGPTPAYGDIVRLLATSWTGCRGTAS